MQSENYLLKDLERKASDVTKENVAEFLSRIFLSGFQKEPNPTDALLQDKFLKIAINAGANIAKYLTKNYVDPRFLSTHKDILITPETADICLMKHSDINVFAFYNDSDARWAITEAAVNKGANFDSYIKNSIGTNIELHHICDHSKLFLNNLTTDTLLNFLSKVRRDNKVPVEKFSELLDGIVAKGAAPDSILKYLSTYNTEAKSLGAHAEEAKSWVYKQFSNPESFKALVSTEPLKRGEGFLLAKSGIDVEGYLHDKQITKNYDWEKITHSYDYFLPSFRYGLSTQHDNDQYFTTKTIELLSANHSLVEMFYVGPFEIGTLPYKWLVEKLTNVENLRIFLELEGYGGVSFLLRSNPEDIVPIIELIDNSDDLKRLIRTNGQILHFFEYVMRLRENIHYFADNAPQANQIHDKLIEMIFKGQGLSNLLYQPLSFKVVDCILHIFTPSIIQKIITPQELKSLKITDINSKFFPFENFELLAFLREQGDGFSDDAILHKLQTDGVSRTRTELVKKSLQFTNEMSQGKLSELELKLINPASNITLDEVKNATLNNSVNYDPMFLALSSGNYKLAHSMLDAGLKFYTEDEAGINKLSLTSIGFRDGIESFIVKAHQHETFSLTRPIGTTNELPIDLLVNGFDPNDYFVELSGDSIYKLKNPENVRFDSIDMNRVNIAISHGDEYWSTGIFSATRSLKATNPDVDFYVVTSNITATLGEKIYSVFDGWINPGAGDSYPTNMTEFSNKHWKPAIGTEIIYQNVLGNATLHNVPTFGFCAGAQNLVLHHGGYIKPIKGYDFGQHNITIQSGSYLSYLALNKQEREELHSAGHMPTMKFKGDTAHGFVAVNDKLPAGFDLGAVSEHNEAMGYCDSTGIHCATQFHPEHYVDALTSGTDTVQAQLLHGFLELARLNHNCKNSDGSCPDEFMAQAKIEMDLHYGKCPLGGEADLFCPILQ